MLLLPNRSKIFSTAASLSTTTKPLQIKVVTKAVCFVNKYSHFLFIKFLLFASISTALHHSVILKYD